MVMQSAIVVDLGRKDLEECWTHQHRMHWAIRDEVIPDCLFLVEHFHVVTIGKMGKKENIPIKETFLRERGIPFIVIDREEEIIYHGPGQLVGYPIFTLEREGIGIIDFLWGLEEVMIRILKDYGIMGKRNEKNRGVWFGKDKVGFVEIADRSGVNLHSFTLNVNPDLSFFELVQPYSLNKVRVTSMNAILGNGITLEEVKERAIVHFQEVFSISMQRMELLTLSL
jgi:lipoyl(octanoyl) transferase